MALNDIPNQLNKAVGNVTALRKKLTETSQQIAKEKADNAKTQQANNGLSNGTGINQ